MNILVIGQGLAATVLSHYLNKHSIEHKVIDKGHEGSSSLAAAGLINPITGRSYVKSWMIEDLLKEAKRCYAELSELLGKELVSETVILRSLRNAAQFNKWNDSTSREGYADFVDDALNVFDYDTILKEVPRFGVIQQAHQIDIAPLIQLYQTQLKEKGDLILESFDHDALKREGDQFVYKGNRYDRLIFCEGYQAVNNRYFKGLPFQPAKGEALEIEIENFESKQILRDDIFIVPLKNGKYWSGGSYIWEFEDDKATEEWRSMWEEKLQKLIKAGYKITSHKAGIRPSVKGRRPLIGEHKDHPGIYIFNGLGTKGSSLAPFWARHLVEDHLLNSMPLDEQVDINRFEY